MEHAWLNELATLYGWSARLSPATFSLSGIARIKSLQTTPAPWLVWRVRRLKIGEDHSASYCWGWEVAPLPVTCCVEAATRLADWRLHVTAIESDADVAAAAHEHFSPEMFRGQPYELEQNHLSVIVADAVELVRDRPFRGEKFDVILEDFAYESPGLLQADFWRALRERYAARDATLIINTLYPERSQMEEFELELQDAGWSDVQQLVDRGLQALPGEPKLSWDTADWEPLDNMIFLAKNQEQAVD